MMHQRLGIGTSSPSDNLHRYDSSAGATRKIESNTANAYGSSKLELLGGNLSVSKILFGEATDNDVGKIIYRHNGNSLSFNVNAAERMRIDSSGRVGIGSYQGWTINAPLNLKSDANHHGLSIEENNGTETWQLGVDVDGDLNFHNSGGATPSVTFNDSGNVGIGTSSATNTLTVDTDMSGEGSQDGGIKIINSHGTNSDVAQIYFGVHG